MQLCGACARIDLVSRLDLVRMEHVYPPCETVFPDWIQIDVPCKVIAAGVLIIATSSAAFTCDLRVGLGTVSNELQQINTIFVANDIGVSA